METYRTKISILFGCTILISALIITGCINQSAKFEKVVRMPKMPISAGSHFATKTHNGSIKVTGSDVTDCNVVATIIGRASSVAAAQEVAEQTELIFENSDDGLVLIIDAPDNMINRSVSVNLEIILPDETDLQLETHNGPVDIKNIDGDICATTHNGTIDTKNIEGDIVATTHNGQVKASDISGQIKLETHNGQIDGDVIFGDMDFKTHNGKIEGRDIAGNIKFETHNGQVEAFFSEMAAPDCKIEMKTYNGGLDLQTPPNYSAIVEVSTHNGSINTSLPVTVTGKLNKKNINGVLGQGKGTLKLETYNGSINIR